MSHFLPGSGSLHKWLWLWWRIALGLNTQPHPALTTESFDLYIQHCIAEFQAPKTWLIAKIILCCAMCYILTQAILSRYQNSFCRFICICITAASAVFMLSTALSSLGNKSTIRCLHTRIVLQKTRENGGGATTENCKMIPQLCWTLHFLHVCVPVWTTVADKLPQVSVQVFQHPVLVLNCLEYGLHHVWAVTVAMWRVRTCTNTYIHLWPSMYYHLTQPCKHILHASLLFPFIAILYFCVKHRGGIN